MKPGQQGRPEQQGLWALLVLRELLVRWGPQAPVKETLATLGVQALPGLPGRQEPQGRPGLE